MCSQSKDKSQTNVDELLAGKGYEKKAEGANAGQGDYCVPACFADGWKLCAGNNADAVSANMRYLVTKKQLIQSL